MRFTLCVCAALLLAAAPPDRQIGESPKEPLELSKTEARTMWDTMGPSMVLGGMMGVLLLALVITQAVVIVRSGKSFEDVRSYQMMGLTVVLGISAVMVAVGWSASQLAVFTGLLGAALGYLFGRQDPPKSSQPPPP